MVKLIVTIEEMPTGIKTTVGGDAGQDTPTVAEAVIGAALKLKINSIVDVGPLSLLANSECMEKMLEKINDLKKQQGE